MCADTCSLWLDNHRSSNERELGILTSAMLTRSISFFYIWHLISSLELQCFSTLVDVMLGVNHQWWTQVALSWKKRLELGGSACLESCLNAICMVVLVPRFEDESVCCNVSRMWQFGANWQSRLASTQHDLCANRQWHLWSSAYQARHKAMSRAHRNIWSNFDSWNKSAICRLSIENGDCPRSLVTTTNMNCVQSRAFVGAVLHNGAVSSRNTGIRQAQCSERQARR